MCAMWDVGVHLPNLRFWCVTNDRNSYLGYHWKCWIPLAITDRPASGRTLTAHSTWWWPRPIPARRLPFINIIVNYLNKKHTHGNAQNIRGFGDIVKRTHIANTERFGTGRTRAQNESFMGNTIFTTNPIAGFNSSLHFKWSFSKIFSSNTLAGPPAHIIERAYISSTSPPFYTLDVLDSIRFGTIRLLQWVSANRMKCKPISPAGPTQNLIMAAAITRHQTRHQTKIIRSRFVFIARPSLTVIVSWHSHRRVACDPFFDFYRPIGLWPLCDA